MRIAMPEWSADGGEQAAALRPPCRPAAGAWVGGYLVHAPEGAVPPAGVGAVPRATFHITRSGADAGQRPIAPLPSTFRFRFTRPRRGAGVRIAL